MIGSDGFDESMVDYVIHADDVTLRRYIGSLFEDESRASKFCDDFRRYDDSGSVSVERNQDLDQFKVLTGADDATAKSYLGKASNLQDAVNAFFESRSSSSARSSVSDVKTTNKMPSSNATTSNATTSNAKTRNAKTCNTTTSNTTSRRRKTRFKSNRRKHTKKSSDKHDWYDCTCRILLTNCLNCGKIICKNEGMGSCNFCGEPLDHVYIQRSQRDGKGSGAFSTRRDRQNARALREQEEKIKAAERTKQRLLEYDRTGAERSRVFDDQADYYSMKNSQWLSTAERARAKKKDLKNQRKTSRRKKKKTVFDLRSKKMIEIDATSSEESDDEGDVFQRNQDEDESGSGMFNNTTLSGRMKDIYNHIVEEAKERRQLRRAAQGEEEEDDTKEDNISSSSTPRLQHSVHNGPSHKLTLSEDKRDVLDLYSTTTVKTHNTPTTRNNNTPSLPELIRPGVVIIRGFLNASEQQHLVDVTRKLGKKRSGGFYIPHYEGGGRQRCAMMCLGKHWNPARGMYESTRSNFDNAPVPAVPKPFLPLVRKAINAAWSCDRSVWPKRKNATIEMIPQLCIANFYTNTGRMGMHQDKHETPYVLKQQIPIVSFSVGDEADFAMSSDLNEDKQQQVVKLCSGDALVFGGISRMMFHGISKVHRKTAPNWLNMRSGRLNLTFRQYDRC